MNYQTVIDGILRCFQTSWRTDIGECQDRQYCTYSDADADATVDLPIFGRWSKECKVSTDGTITLTIPERRKRKTGLVTRGRYPPPCCKPNHRFPCIKETVVSVKTLNTHSDGYSPGNSTSSLEGNIRINPSVPRNLEYVRGEEREDSYRTYRCNYMLLKTSPDWRKMRDFTDHIADPRWWKTYSGVSNG